MLQDDIGLLIDAGVLGQDESKRYVVLSSGETEGRLLAGSASSEGASGGHESIEDIQDHLIYEIEKAVLELDEAMYIAMVSFAFPLQILMAYIYSQYTDRNFSIRRTIYIDLAIFFCVLIWFEKFEEYMHDSNEGFGLEDPPHKYHIFMQRLLDDVNSGDFHIEWLLAATAFLFWIRLISMLELTNTFGPLIGTIVAMSKDLMIFFLLWII